MAKGDLAQGTGATDGAELPSPAIPWIAKGDLAQGTGATDGAELPSPAVPWIAKGDLAQGTAITAEPYFPLGSVWIIPNRIGIDQKRTAQVFVCDLRKRRLGLRFGR